MNKHEQALLPCPFCGGEANYGSSENGKHSFIACSDCLAATNHLIPHMNSESDAAHLWNTRHQAALPQADEVALSVAIRNLMNSSIPEEGCEAEYELAYQRVEAALQQQPAAQDLEGGQDFCKELKPCPYVNGYSADNSGVSWFVRMYDTHFDFVLMSDGKPDRCFQFNVPTPPQSREEAEKLLGE